MTEHERAVKAAKAGLAKAQELGLPPEAPELGLRHEFEGHIARLERTIADEADARVKAADEDLKLRGAVRRLVRAVKVIVPALFVFVLVATAVGLVAFDRISAQADSLAAVGNENRRLILANERTQRAAAIAVKETAIQARRVIRDTCRIQNRDRGKIRTIFVRGEATIAQYVAEGTITQAQADRALRESRRARRELHDDKCAKRAARIPVIDVLP